MCTGITTEQTVRSRQALRVWVAGKSNQVKKNLAHSFFSIHSRLVHPPTRHFFTTRFLRKSKQKREACPIFPNQRWSDKVSHELTMILQRI
jgi:hypothetical protein